MKVCLRLIRLAPFSRRGIYLRLLAKLILSSSAITTSRYAYPLDLSPIHWIYPRPFGFFPIHLDCPSSTRSIPIHSIYTRLFGLSPIHLDFPPSTWIIPHPLDLSPSIRSLELTESFANVHVEVNHRIKQISLALTFIEPNSAIYNG